MKHLYAASVSKFTGKGFDTDKEFLGTFSRLRDAEDAVIARLYKLPPSEHWFGDVDRDFVTVSHITKDPTYMGVHITRKHIEEE